MSTVKITDVAKLANVGIGTVSRVLNDAPNVSEKSRQKVLDAIEKLNYKPDAFARGFKSKDTGFVGILLPRIDNVFYSKLVYYIEQNLQQHNYKLVLCNSKYDIDREFKYIDLLQQYQVQGIFLITDYIRMSDLKPGLPIVSFDRKIDNISYVASDNYKGGCIATERLIKSGCENLAFLGMITNVATNTSSMMRKQGFIDTCHKHNVKYSIFEEKVEFGKEKAIAQKLFESQIKVDGVFCASDLIALNLYALANENQVNVPHDLQIIGYDGVYKDELSFPKVTSIMQPIEEIAEKMCEILISKMLKKDVDDEVEFIFEAKLFEGETTLR